MASGSSFPNNPSILNISNMKLTEIINDDIRIDEDGKINSNKRLDIQHVTMLSDIHQIQRHNIPQDSISLDSRKIDPVNIVNPSNINRLQTTEINPQIPQSSTTKRIKVSSTLKKEIIKEYKFHQSIIENLTDVIHILGNILYDKKNIETELIESSAHVLQKIVTHDYYLDDIKKLAIEALNLPLINNLSLQFFSKNKYQFQEKTLSMNKKTIISLAQNLNMLLNMQINIFKILKAGKLMVKKE